MSVVVCAYNAASTIDACLSAIEALHYPNFDVIVVNDGSSDETGTIAARHAGIAVIHTPNSGLAAARNIGLQHARGDIVAYTDADTRVDPDWLTYLVQPFLNSDVVAAGGPNIVPPDDPWFAQCVARAPGGPTHVLFDDRLAEHVPGCNIAFRRDALIAIGGFNPIFLRAGDDVDVCWRLLARDWKIGFAPAALVWHHHRASLRAYLRQQVGYGEGEAWLMPEHPDKFVSGLIAWRGHIYSSLPFLRSLSATRVNTGPFGSAAFPSVYRTRCHPFTYLPHSESWQIGWVVLLLAAGAFGLVERPFAPVVLCVALAALLVTVAKDVLYGLRSDIRSLPRIGRLPGWASRSVQRLTIAALHFLQPFARLHGRLRGRLYMPARRGERRRRVPPMKSRLAAFARAARFVLCRRVEVVYERHAWIDLQIVWLGIVERLRAQRAVRQVEIDSGWWEDHDLTIVDRSWFRLDVRGLVEDHGERWLLRLATRLRFTAAVVRPVTVGAVTVIVLHVANVVSWPLGAALSALLAAGVMAWSIATTSTRLEEAVSDIARSLGMHRFKPVTQPNVGMTDRSEMDVAVSR